jgi:hypothetical protein
LSCSQSNFKKEEIERDKTMTLLKMTAAIMISSLFISTASTPARSAAPKDEMPLVGEAVPIRNGSWSPLNALPSGIALAARHGQMNCKPSHLYSDGVVGDPESCIMGDRLSIGGGHVGGR